jgi:hypothetical protein
LSSAKTPPPQTKKKPATKRRSVSPSPSTPELKLSYQPAGRDTLAAIDEELAHALPSPAEAPVIEISETAVGRDTMAAIAEELNGVGRARQDTLPYPDKIKNAPGARSPSRAPAPPKAEVAKAEAPPKAEVAKAEAPPKAAASPAPAAEAPDEVTVRVQRPPLPPTPSVEGVEIFELLTFIVRGTGVGDLSTDASRRKFVQEHLLRRVPSGSLDGVERIEVTPWTAKGTMVMRIWCRP